MARRAWKEWYLEGRFEETRARGRSGEDKNKQRLMSAHGQLWVAGLYQVRFERMLQTRRKLGVQRIVEEPDAAIVVAGVLLGGVDIVIEIEAHGIVLLLSRSSSMD